MTILAKDANGNAIQAVGFKPSGAKTISIGGTTARNASAIVSDLCYIYSSVDCYIEQGSSSVEATTSNHFIPASTVYAIKTTDHKYIAVIQASGAGTFYISETE